MTDQPPPIQFDRADYVAPAAQACAACGRAPQGVYYTANNKIICAPCRDAFLASTTGGSRVARFGRAMLFGLGAGVAGGILWFAVRKLLHMEIGLIAIVVGYMVGTAVRKGSRARGGIAYQLLAVLLTYSCIVSTYVPDIFTELRDDVAAKHESRVTAPAATRPATAPTTTATAAAADPQADDDARQRESFRQWSPVKKVGMLMLFAVVLFAIALAAPVLAGASNIIGLLIIAFALWEAWKINRKRAIAITGPHAIAPPPQPTL